MEYEHEDAIRVTTRRARIVKVDDAKSQQRVDIKGLKEEEPKKIWRPQDFGFSSNPPKDCDGVMVQMGSRSDRTLYFDGGHEKYRPKKTPEGGTVLFNHSGDIIRVFKDNMDHVHSKLINIRIGKGYHAGQSSLGSGQNADDAHEDDTKTISIVLKDGEAITLTYQGSSVTLREDGHIVAQAASQFSGGVNGGRWVVVRSGRVDLGVTGPDEMAPCKVSTECGFSEIVYARID